MLMNDGPWLNSEISRYTWYTWYTLQNVL